MNIYKSIKIKENYTKLLESGMFHEFHPELTGSWDVDIELMNNINYAEFKEDIK